jgi:hypothetical protein
MRFFRESLLSIFVVGIVLCLYFLAAVAVLLTFRDSRDRGSKRESLHHFETATDRNLRDRANTTG